MSSSHCVIPPPVPPNFGTATTKRSYLYSPCSLRKTPVECLWAAAYPDVQKACCLAHICTAMEPKEYCIKLGIQSIIQEGPTCGMAALAMVAGMSASNVTDILHVAKEQTYTNHGEMFSARNMLQLGQHIFQTIAKDYVNIRLHLGQFNCDEIRCALKNGACIMIAYDSDFNHAPCLKNGHKAHWALITGYLVDEKDEFHIFVRHGKTKNLALWTMSSLSESNSNLNEYTAPQRYDEYSFQLPSGGISGSNGLKNQCLLINNLRNLDEIKNT